MNQKHNPYFALVALLILALIVSFVCNGCAVEANAAGNNERFDVDIQFTSGFRSVHIITDTETGVQYLYYRSGSGSNGGSGLTRLEVE
jgi:hypothetical protein